VQPLATIADSPQLLKLAHVIKDEQPDISFTEWSATLKDRAAKAGLVYEAGSIAKAISQAEHQRKLEGKDTTQ